MLNRNFFFINYASNECITKRYTEISYPTIKRRLFYRQLGIINLLLNMNTVRSGHTDSGSSFFHIDDTI